MNRKILISITALFLCFCMAGCSLPSFLEGTFLEYFFNDEEVAPPNYPVTYAGITFDVEPTKIVSLSPAVTEILYDIGLASKLVAKSDNCTYPDSSSAITAVGTYLEPDTDKIIELSANLVITPSALSKSDMAKLNTAGIKVLTLKNPQSLADVSKNIYTLFVLLQGDYDGKINGARYIQNFHYELDSIFAKLRTYF
ncbi:MAG: ABC transporter substrate-binding protein, partial [Oscillospiraceae bacterium]|nr:ABC transporter substrate-binding protein [Oscillospiraceae bacterium]